MPKNSLIIRVPDPEKIELVVKEGRKELKNIRIPYKGAVDNELLTAVDNLFQENILDRLAPISVKAGKGVDKKSILYRMVLTLAAALGRSAGN